MATTVSLKPNAVEISGSTSGTTTLQATAVAGTTTLTLPAATDTLVGKATTDTLTNKTLTGAAMNGTLGATTPSTVAATTLTTSSTVTHNGGTANGVAYLNGSKVLTTGSALVFDGTNLGIGTSSPSDTVGYGRALDIQSTTGAAIYLRDSDNPTTQYGLIAFDGNASVNNLNIINASSTGPIRLFTNGTEAARIDSSGNLLVGTTSQINIGLGNFYLETNAKRCIETKVNTTAASDHIAFFSPSGQAGQITVTSTVTAYGTSSDYRLKNTIAPMTSALAKVAQLKPCTYKWNADDSDGEGFIAHELQSVVPDAVIGEKDAVNKDGNPVYQGVDYGKITPLLTAALQEAIAKIELLEARLASLESK